VKYAFKYPERVEKLILVSPVGIPNHESISPERIDPEYQPSIFLRIAETLWAREISPQALFRSLGPFGQIITNRYATRRFELGSPSLEEKAAIGEYIYQISAGKGSGEYSAPRLLYPFFTGIKEQDGSKSMAGKYRVSK
jgi:cardiolipin-specific phospholipase